MRLYYTDDGGDGPHGVITVVYDRDAFVSSVRIASAYSTMAIDEIDPDNKAICADLVAMSGREDVNGDGRYYVMIEAGDPVLYERDGWEAFETDG